MKDQPLKRLDPAQILAGLERALRAERQAVADYHAQSQACDQPAIRDALETLRDVEREHELRLALRMAALGGSPPSAAAEPRPLGASLSDWLAQDLRDEQWAIIEYARLVAEVFDDAATVELMTELLIDEIRHAAWLKEKLWALVDE